MVKDIEAYRNTLSANTKYFENAIRRIDKDSFIQEYIQENHSRKWMIEKYALSEYLFDKLVAYFDCHKSKKQAASLVLETKYNNAGSKEQYDITVYEKAKQGFINRDGSIEAHYAKVSDSCKRSWNSKSDSDIQSINSKRSVTCNEKFGVPFACMRAEAKAGNKFSHSKPNEKFAELLEEHNIEYSREFPLDSYSYDFKLADNTLIEIDPTATHNSTWSPFGEALDKNYHFNKSKVARDNNYRCIHIFDWDDIDKILYLITKNTKLYARQCGVRVVDKIEEKTFLDTYHLQGYVSSKICLGLYYQNQLVSLMSFGKPRYNKKYEYELLRYVSCCNVIGGAQKLFKYFLKQYEPNSIISYCDLSKFSGDLYQKLCFTYQGVSVGKHWYDVKTKQHITDNLLRQHGFDQLFHEHYGKGTDNSDLMRDHGFVEIYDAGQATYVLTV